MNARAEIEVLDRLAELRPVVGYEGLYSITRDGQVWSHSKTRVIGQGRVRTYAAKWLRHWPSTDGYPQVCLMKAGVGSTRKVHRLVAFAWIGNPPTAGHEVNHKDGDKRNASVTNLEWVTRSENVRHAFATGLNRITEKNRSATANSLLAAHAAARKITHAEADEIRRLVAAGMKKSHAGARFGLTYWSVRDIVSGKTYITSKVAE